MSTPSDITNYLQEFARGDAKALDELIPLVYEKMHAIAQREISREREGHTLSATALVNEAYLNIKSNSSPHWENRGQFFALSCVIMRRVLVDHARSRLRQKRGAGAESVPIEDVEYMLADKPAGEILEIDQLLTQLGSINSRAAKVVEHRYFGGLSNEETAEALNTSPATVKRDWQMARAWLLREMQNNS